MVTTTTEHAAHERDYPIEIMLNQLGMLSGENKDPYAQQLVTSEARTVQHAADLEADIQAALTPATPYKGVDIVACGSLARHEWTLASDFDYLLIVDDPSDVSGQAIRYLQRQMLEIIKRHNMNPPGATGTFGQAISSFDLTSKIGLETDTNAVTTHRILMLEESISLREKTSHQRLIEGILERYLAEYRRPGNSISRLLLNDVVKYWRILAVDYSSKNWLRPTDAGWGLRYLKLRITRKLAFAGMLAAIFDIALRGETLTADRLYKNLKVPALARLGLLSDSLEDKGKDALRSCLSLAGHFNQMLDDEDFRTMASGIEWDGMQDRKKPAQFKEAEKVSRDLQISLQDLFFSGSDCLSSLTQKYGVF